MRVLESAVESKCIAYAVEMGLITMKISPMGQKGWPDRVFIRVNGEHFYVEFKAPGKKLRKLQLHRFSQLTARNVSVFVCDNFEDFKKYVNETHHPIQNCCGKRHKSNISHMSCPNYVEGSYD